MLVTTARSAHCQRNSSRQYCSEDFFHDSTKNKRKTKQDSEGHTRQQTTLRRTEWLAEMPRVGNQNVDSDSWFHESFWLHYSQINLEITRILRYQTRLHQPPEEDIQRQEGICTDGCREQHARHQERNQTRWSSVKLAVQHGSSILTEGRHSSDGTRNKEWESARATTTTTASRTWGLPTTCFCSQPVKSSFKKCCVISR